jgi:hypothetical protein
MLSLLLAPSVKSALAENSTSTQLFQANGVYEPIDKEPKEFHSLPKGAPKALRYYKKGARFPSCGIVSYSAAVSTFLPILETEVGNQFPNCYSIDDAVAFAYENRTIFVYQYTTQETRNNSEVQYFFVTTDQNEGILPLPELNNDNPPNGSTVRLAASWALMKLHRKSLQGTSFVFQERDSVTSQYGLFALDFDRANKQCKIVALPSTLGGAPIQFQSSCDAPVATSLLRSNGKDFFIVMLEVRPKKFKGYIASIQNGTAAMETEILSKLTSSASSGKVLQLKSQLKRELGM